MSKKQWKNVDLNFQFSTAKNSDWAQEEVEAPLIEVGAIRSNLPTQTNATRQMSELDNISPDGPFILSFSNIPYEATEEELRSFLRGSDISKVVMNERRRGYGLMEFANLTSLTDALKSNEKIFKSRPIKMHLASNEDIARSNGASGKYRNQNDHKQGFPSLAGLASCDDSDNWRSVKKTQPASQQQFPARGSVIGSSPVSSSGSSWKTRPSAAGGSSVTPPSSAVTGVTPTTDAAIEEADNWRRPRVAGDHPPGAPSDSTNAIAVANSVSSTTAAPRKDDSLLTFTRKPPKTESDITTTAPSAIKDDFIEVKKVNIFGGAKPIDTSAKEREIEDKMAKQRILLIDTSKQAESTPTTSSAVAQSRPNPWGSKSFGAGGKVTTTPSAAALTSPTGSQDGNKLEWRSGNKPVPGPRIVQKQSGPASPSTTNQAEITAPIPTEVPMKKKPELAPAPAVNVWEERKKSKNKQSTTGNIITATTVDTTTASTTGAATTASSPVSVKFVDVRGENANNNAAEDMPSQKSLVSFMSPTSIVEEAIETNNINVTDKQQKTAAVVISANGPFLDPKSHKTQQQMQHFVTDNSHKLPKVVPLTKVATVSSQPTNMESLPAAVVASSSSTVLPSTEGLKLANPSSSWAKGPPRALLDKQ